jgi:hypothetical protein
MLSKCLNFCNRQPIDRAPEECASGRHVHISVLPSALRGVRVTGQAGGASGSDPDQQTLTR